MNFTEAMWAVQWKNPDTGVWEICQSFDHLDKEVATIYEDKEMAEQELQEWDEPEAMGAAYRVVQITITTKE